MLTCMRALSNLMTSSAFKLNRPDVHVVRAGMKAFSEDGETLEFQDGSKGKFDVVLCATGYRQYFPFLFPAGNRDSSSEVAEDDPLPNEHNIVNTDEPTMAFLGFVRPNVGAIPPMAEMQLFWWIQRLRGTKHYPSGGYLNTER